MPKGQLSSTFLSLALLSPLVGYQATVECAERGELLASLRRYYQGLLERAPIQVKGLHDEVMAQRALDRRLTEELVRFKRAIGGLTAELTDVKRHDQQSFSDAQFSREEVSVLLNEMTQEQYFVVMMLFLFFEFKCHKHKPCAWH